MENGIVSLISLFNLLLVYKNIKDFFVFYILQNSKFIDEF